MNSKTLLSISANKIICWILLLLSLVLLLPANDANAQCPAGDPCATSSFYRIQSWPMPLEDADGRSLLSLQEADATDLAAFTPIINSMAGSTSLAIRFNVTRITTKPQDYCECNFELNAKGCHSGLPASEILQCVRNCRRGQDACTGSGNIVKQSDGGYWYSFPASTEMGAGGIWKKNVFEVKPINRDWAQNSSTIKSAACFADALKANPETSIDALFDNEQLCPVIPLATLEEQAIRRNEY